MPPRRGRSRIARQVYGESRAPGSDEDVEQQGIPLRRRARQVEVEVDVVTRHIGEMELVLARFQRMNPSKFTGVEAGMLAEGWLEHMEELLDAVEYSQERRLNLAVLQLREHAQRWWKGTSRVMRETGVLIYWESFCADFRQEYTPESFYNNPTLVEGYFSCHERYWSSEFLGELLCSFSTGVYP
ncbi:hypothetical protein F511_13387 [Dorcoceras hygrometricum]|uniref:Retrotransposon gag domain-containing protein n=1 Tax=Dorcoceras hygrometricum TaxID=472368 RepID=A0A2Z7B5Q3_9LAMI|nr:hypothetical protein F511_13387 [Dorcoceras hygrometricum]